jgi:hypothetical protein
MLPASAPIVTAPRRWPRGQKFTLSAAGETAELAHREAVNGARSSGRASLQSALAAWAGSLGVQGGDGLLLVELRGQKKGLNDLARALEDAGIEAAEVKAAVDRLVVAGLAQPVPLASQAG